VLELAVASSARSRSDVTEWIATAVQPRIAAVPGVGDVSLSGDAPRQLEIEFDPSRAGALNVALQDVIAAVTRENVDVRTGYVQSGSQQRMLRVVGRFDSPASFEQLPVRKVGPMIVRLGDIATVHEGAAEPTALMRFNGRDCVSIKVFPLPKANVADTASRLRAAMQELATHAPSGMVIETVVDNSEYARASLTAVLRSMLEGAALTVLLVALCLRSIRSSFITSLTLPLSVLVTVAVLWGLGYSLNLFTLLALTLSIGILIDDAIVVRENIVRHGSLGVAPRDAAIRGTVELARAVASTTFVIAAVFIPLALTGGPLAPFVRQFGLTVAIAVSVSLVVSFTVDPALSVLLARTGRRAPGDRQPDREPSPRNPRWAAWLVPKLIGARYAVVAATISLLGACAWLFHHLPTELMPEFDEAIAALNVQLPPGSSPDFMRVKAQQIERAAREIPEIVDVLTSIGTPRSRNAVTLFVRLTPPSKRAAGFRDVEETLRKRLDRIAGVTTASTSLPIGILLSGPDEVVLEKLRLDVTARLARIRGLTTVAANDVEAGQAVVLEVHRDRLVDAGASFDQVADTLSAFVSGAPIGSWSAPNGRQYDITVRFPKSVSGDVTRLSDIELVSGSADARSATPLHAVANLRVGDRPRLIERVDGIRLRRVQAAIAGRPLGEVRSEVNAALASLQIPVGYQVAYGGKIRELEEAHADFKATVGLAALLVFCTLTVFFGGLLLPLIVMSSIPLGVLGALGWIWLSNGTLNVFSGVGLLLVAGIVAKNGILLVDFARRAERDGLSREASIAGALAQRMRPILMTSAAMALGMLPLAFGIGHGGEQLSAMGQAVVSGIVSSTLLSLIVVPALYSLYPRQANPADEPLPFSATCTVAGGSST
jgi:HAE1 family hydrophobic/amphiphilic exporter-1